MDVLCRLRKTKLLVQNRIEGLDGHGLEVDPNILTLEGNESLGDVKKFSKRKANKT
jgi:hypothetical protein